MKILILSPNQIKRYNWGHQLFRNEIGRQHETVYYGDGYPDFNKNLTAKEIIKKNYKNSKPDLILTYGWRYSVGFKGLGEIDDIAKVHITCDYGGRPENVPRQNKLMLGNKYDLIFGVTSRIVRCLEENKVSDKKIILLPFAVDITRYKKLDVKKQDKILAAFATRADIYPTRVKARRVLQAAGFKLLTKRIIHQNYINAINMCKITMTNNNFVGSLSMKYTETLACGGFLLADKPQDFNKLGFKDKVHMVLYNDLNDLVEKAKYYMSNDTEREKISQQGMKFVRENHSCEKRVKEMISVIKDTLGI